MIRAVGDRASATRNVNVRATAGNASFLRTVSGGTAGTVLDGPQIATVGAGAYRYIWWKMHWDDGGTDGWSVEDYMARSAAAPSIALDYGGTTLPNGDQAPSAAKGTDFGAVSYGFQTSPRTFTIRNAGSWPATIKSDR